MKSENDEDVDDSSTPPPRMMLSLFKELWLWGNDIRGNDAGKDGNRKVPLSVEVSESAAAAHALVMVCLITVAGGAFHSEDHPIQELLLVFAAVVVVFVRRAGVPRFLGTEPAVEGVRFWVEFVYWSSHEGAEYNSGEKSSMGLRNTVWGGG